MTLYLNKFRGVPAITKFDWPFTPNRSSSQYIATYTSAALQTTYSVKFSLTTTRSLSFGSNLTNFIHSFKICFRYVTEAPPLNLLIKLTCWPIIQKVHRNNKNYHDCSFSIRFQVLFTPIYRYFSSFLHSTFHYRLSKSI